MINGKVLSINISREKGVPKKKVKRAFLKAHWGIVNDAHAGTNEREISILPIEALSVVPEDIRKKWAVGGYSENLTIAGIPMEHLKIGTFLKIGESVVEILHIGKEELHDEGRPYVVSREGRFGSVLKDGWVKVGDVVVLLHELRVGILVASDKGASGERVDRSGPTIEEKVKTIGGRVVFYKIVPDEVDVIYNTLREWIDSGNVDLILTSGGTGFSERDVTPEATARVIERSVPGFSEIMRVVGYMSSPVAILSRGVSGISGKTMVINLPGSVKGVKESLDLILEPLAHGMDILLGRETDHG